MQIMIDAHKKHRLGTFQTGICALVCICLLTASYTYAEFPEADLPTVSISADPMEITIGDRITVDVTIEYNPQKIELAEQSVTPDFGAFELQGFQFGEPESLPDGKARRIDHYTVSTYVTGDYEVPPLTIAFTYHSGDAEEQGTVSTTSLPIHVRRLTPEESENLTLRPPKPQLSVEGESRLPMVIAIAAAVLVVILALLFWAFAYRRKQEAIAIAEKIPPHVIAQRILSQLRETIAELDTEAASDWMERLTAALRDYLLRIWAIDAPDSTTSEIIAALRVHEKGQAYLPELKKILEAADYVKFAQIPTSQDQGRELLDEMESFVEKTKPVDETTETDDNKSPVEKEAA